MIKQTAPENINSQQVEKESDPLSLMTQEVSQYLLDHISLLTFQPKNILDLSADADFSLPLLHERFADSQIVALDIHCGRLNDSTLTKSINKINADVHTLPFASNSMDLVYSNLALAWCTDHKAVFNEMQRLLQTERLFLFSTFGPDTDFEYTTTSNNRQLTNMYLHDMHSIGDALLKCGFKDPVVDRDVFEKPFGTFEVIYGIAWGAEVKKQRVNHEGDVEIRVDAIKGTKEIASRRSQ